MHDPSRCMPQHCYLIPEEHHWWKISRVLCEKLGIQPNSYYSGCWKMVVVTQLIVETVEEANRVMVVAEVIYS